MKWLKSLTNLILVVSMTSGIARADSTYNGVLEKIKELKYTVTANKINYSQSDYAEIIEAVQSAVDRALNPSGDGPGSDPATSSACQQAAYNLGGLRGDQIVQVCRRSSKGTPSCISNAYRFGLQGDDMVEICSGAPSTFVGPCIDSGYNFGGLRGQELIELCSKVRTSNHDCIRAAYSFGLRDNEKIAVCKQPNKYSAVCISQAYNAGGLRESQIVEVCLKPKASTSTCIASAYRNGLNAEQMIDLCK